MPEVTNELLLEVLKKIQDQLTRVQSDVHGIREELSAIRGHMNAMQRDIHVIRVDRIERRLELSDAHS